MKWGIIKKPMIIQQEKHFTDRGSKRTTMVECKKVALNKGYKKEKKKTLK